MKHILAIALKDMQETMRDRMTFMFLLAMPVIFTLMFGFAFGGAGTNSADSRPVVGYLDQDNSRLSAALKEFLLAAGDVRLDETAGRTPADLEKLAAEDKLAAALVVPAGYGDSAAAGKLMKLAFVSGSSSASALAAQAAILAAAGRAASAVAAAQSVSQVAGTPYAGALEEALAGWQKPPVSLAVTSSEPPAQAAAGGNPMTPAQTAPAMMIQFAMAGLITSAQVLVNERKSKCMQRLLTTAVARWQILLGHALAIFVTIFVQLVLLILFGQLVFKLDYLGQPLATLVMALATAVLMATMGLLIGTLAKSDDQAIIFSMLPMFVFAALGGAWVPLETVGGTFQVVGHFSPVAWAMDGFKNIIAHGLGLAGVWLPAAALLGYAVLFGGLAVWKFKYE